MTENEYNEKILEKIKEMSDVMHSSFDTMKSKFDNLPELNNEVVGLPSDFNE